MKTLLRGAAHIATFDDAGGEYTGANVLIRENVIEAVGAAAEGAPADAVIDCSNLVLLPGLVNTHHHFYQSLTRCVPGAQDADLFTWLQRLYPIWARLTPESLRLATMLAAAELLRSGCTTSADHQYLWPNGCTIDDQIEAAREIGIRFHATRGSMSLGQSKGGLPPDDLVEDEDAILQDCERAIARFHDPQRYAMTRIALAPCSPFSVTPDLMRATIALARRHGVHAHTHLAESLDEERFCIERFGCRPIELAERLEWTGRDVWHAHVVHPSADECTRLGATQTGIAHCPSSNMRLGSGIAPLRALISAGARVGFGVDGSASNDSSDMLGEARQAMLLQRVGSGAGAIGARESLRIATRGGAALLGRDEIGTIAPGMAADIVGWRIDTLEVAGGAVHDPVAALLFCRSRGVDLAVVDGRVLIRNGDFTDLDEGALIRGHNTAARALLSF